MEILMDPDAAQASGNRGSVMTGPKCFGVFGDPVAHSKSPAMHGAAFRALGLTHQYLPFHVAPAHLGDALRGAAQLGFGGLNLTVPHKIAALPHMDRLTPEAERIGAVNTVVFEDRQLVGHNTDGQGFVRALAELGDRVPRRVVVLGSGGASRAVIDAVLGAYPSCRVDWVSRSPDELPARDRVHPCAYGSLARSANGPVDVLVNGTTVGMAGGASRFPVELPLDQLAARARVVDLVYPRPPGGLLDRAAARGAVTQDGLPTLLWQGVEALERWLGGSVPAAVVESMRHALG
jgi:shikimate dehydrogenase